MNDPARREPIAAFFPTAHHAMTWQPIDTAPRDGTEILASDCDAIEIVSWAKWPCYRNEWESRNGELMFPSWWQPLPDHPRSGEG